MKPTPRFAALCAASLLVTAAGLVETRWLALAAGADVALAVAFAVALVRRLPVDALRVTREAESVLVVRTTSDVRVAIANAGRRALRVRVRDLVPDGTRALDALAPCWVPAGGTAERRYRLAVERRGVAAYGDLHLRVTDRLGLVERDVCVPAAQPVRIYPAPLPRAGLPVALTHAATAEPGSARLRVAGEGTLLEGLRPWVPGDDPRLVDWKATARRGTPIVREVRPERNQRVILAIDQGRALASRLRAGTKLDRAVEAAHQLALAALEAGDDVGLVGFDAVPRVRLAPGRGAGHGRRVLDALVGLVAEPVEPDYGAAFGALARLTSRRSLVVLFTDVTDPESSRTVIAHLGALVPRHLPLCITVEDSALVAAALGTDTPSGERRTADDVFRAAAARELVEDQQRALEGLRLRGVLTVHVPAEALAAATIERYLDVKYRGRL